MMKKTGFTLIELLAVLVILAIITSLSMPTILNQINKKRVEVKDTNDVVIQKAAELYFDNDFVENKVYCVQLSELVNRGYLQASDNKIIDPTNPSSGYSVNDYASIISTASGLQFEIGDECLK